MELTVWFEETNSERSDWSSGSERPQPQLHVVREPNGFGSGRGVAHLLARPHGGGKVAEVVSDLEGDGDVGVLLLLRDDLDEEPDLVGFPEGDDTEDDTEKSRSPS